MAENPNSKIGRPTLGPLTASRAPGADLKPQAGVSDEDFPDAFARVKLTVIRPAFESIGAALAERGYEINIAEDPHGKLSIHIVPAGVNKTVHGWDWFPTLSFFGVAYSKTIGLQGRNARRNSEGSTGSRGDYKPAQISKELVEKEVTKFVGEIANW